MGPADLERRLCQSGAGDIDEIGRGRALHHLLVAALDGAVALEHDVAVAVAEQLHLDVAGAPHQLLQIDLVLAERCIRLAQRSGDGVDQPGRSLARPHAAATASPRRLQHHRIADGGGELLDVGRIVRQRVGSRHYRHADRDGEVARGYLVRMVSGLGPM